MEYPKNYRELVTLLGTETDCFAYLEGLRWPGGLVCPRCKGKKFWDTKQKQKKCSNCGERIRVLAGTLFQDTKLPLNLWFQMIWWFVGPKNGASALSLMQNFGIGSYRTSWKLLKKLRECAVMPMREPLSGDVEVDEAFLGGENNKKIVIVAAEKRGRSTGRIRLKFIKNRQAKEFQGFIKETILPGSKIISDRHQSYKSIATQGYGHDPQIKPYFWEEVDGDDERLLPRVHRIISLMKRWFYGTYQGRVDDKSLQLYLDEFVFRFNRRTSSSRGLLFRRMVEAAIHSKPKPS